MKAHRMGNVYRHITAWAEWSAHSTKERSMGLILVVLLLALLLGGLGFMAHLLWIVAAVVLVLWLVGFVATGAGEGRRWYRW
jgi:hypothetical protein